ncbi:hypothetical protein MP228_000432 [Amoeboaphelidium protococcarum]|nr:hypothetical protein MP228_000432 [Amoeboaphelidium protococcarum]
MCIQWIKPIAATCIHNNLEAASLMVGYSSIVLWMCAQLPQVIKNYRQSNADSLSLLFLFIWFCGDLSNLLGCLFTDQMPFQLYLACYFVFLDLILLSQYLYYVTYRQRRSHPSFQRLFNTPHKDVDHPNEYTGLLSDQQSGLKRHPQHHHYRVQSLGVGNKTIRYMTFICMLIAMTSAHSQNQFLSVFGVKNPPAIEDPPQSQFPPDAGHGGGNGGSGDKTREIVGTVFAWISLVSYLCSRMPQIIKNYQQYVQKKMHGVGNGMEGLSIWLFAFAVMGNLTYSLSIFLKAYSVDTGTSSDGYGSKYIIGKSLPYLMGSLGTLVFDFVIFAQWVMYSEPASTSSQMLINKDRSPFTDFDDQSCDGGDLFLSYDDDCDEVSALTKVTKTREMRKQSSSRSVM